MKQVTLILLVAFSFSLFAQDDKVGMTLIENWIKTINPTGQIIYTDKLNKWEIDQINKAILKRKISGNTDSTKQNSIKLSLLERKYVYKKVERVETNVWKDSLFENSQRISTDSVMTYILKKRSDLAKIYNSVNDSIKFTMQYDIIHTDVFMFSKPIFIRNNTVCFFFSMYMCGTECGRTDLNFYKLTNRNWNKFVDSVLGVF